MGLSEGYINSGDILESVIFLTQNNENDNQIQKRQNSAIEALPPTKWDFGLVTGHSVKSRND